MKRLCKFIELATIVCVISIVCLGCQDVSKAYLARSTPIPIDPTKQILSNNLPLVEVWRTSGVMYGVVISKDYIITKQATAGDNRIVVFDAHTGNIIWESTPIYHLNSIHADSERVYVGGIRQVQAYDLDTGQFLWKGAEQDINKRGGLKVYAEGTELNAYDLYGNRVYTLDAETGQTIDEIDYPRPYFVRDDIYFSIDCGGNRPTCLSAREAVNGKMLWSYNFNGYVLSWPVFVKDNIFVTGEDQLLAIDTRLGEIIWSSKEANFATAMALGNNQLYVIRNDAAIISINPKTVVVRYMLK